MVKKFRLAGLTVLGFATVIAFTSVGSRQVASRDAIEMGLSRPTIVESSTGKREQYICIDRLGECGTSCPEINKFKVCVEDTSACPEPGLSIKLICR